MMTDRERLKNIQGNWEYEKCIKPEDVELLISTVEEQQKEIAHWKKGFENENKIAGRLRKKFERLEKENARLRKALEMYADIDNYIGVPYWVGLDQGERAREALEGEE